MSLLGVTIYLTCFMTSYAYQGSGFQRYCYDPPELSCAEQHILDCTEEGQVITTDRDGSRVSFFKNKNVPAECKTKKDECKNKTYCCQYINKEQKSKQEIIHFSEDEAPLIKFIKTECSSKSSCIVSSQKYFNSHGTPDLYDYVIYNYGCINASKDAITVDFLVNGSTKFTGNRFPTIYYLDYTGNRTNEDNETILNRECTVTTTEKDITLTIKTLNLQADDCCRFHISGHNVSDYCSQSGSFVPPKRKNIGKEPATIRLENVVNKDGDKFSILVTAAGNVTIDCREFKQDSKQEPITCQYPTPVSSTISSNSTNSIVTISPMKEGRKMEDSETNLPGIIGGTVGGLVVLVVIIIVVVVIMRRRRRPKNKVDENNYYTTIDDNPKNNQEDNSEDNPTGNSNYAYIDIDLDKVGYKTIPNNNSATQVKSSGGKDKTKENNDDKKRSVPNEKSNPERKRESEAAHYTNIDESMIKPLDKPSASAAKDIGPQYSKVNKKHGKFIPTNDKAVNLDNYNHIGLKEEPPRTQADNYNHIDFNFKKDNSLPKGSNSKANSNYNSTEIDLPQEDERDDPYDRAKQLGESLNQEDKEEHNVSDTYNHIGTKNENFMSKRDNSESDTYNHIGINNDNVMSKGDNSESDTYNHIGIKNDEGANSTKPQITTTI